MWFSPVLPGIFGNWYFRLCLLHPTSLPTFHFSSCDLTRFYSTLPWYIINSLVLFGKSSAINTQCDARKASVYGGVSKNIQRIGCPFKSHVFCWVYRALSCGSYGLRGPGIQGGMKLSFIPPCIPDSHPYRVKNTKCHIDTVISAGDGHSHPKHVEKRNKHAKKNCAQVGFIYKIIQGCTVNKT